MPGFRRREARARDRLPAQRPRVPSRRGRRPPLPRPGVRAPRPRVSGARPPGRSIDPTASNPRPGRGRAGIAGRRPADRSPRRPARPARDRPHRPGSAPRRPATSCSRTSTRRGSPPANAPAPCDFQSSANSRSAVAPQRAEHGRADPAVRPRRPGRSGRGRRRRAGRSSRPARRPPGTAPASPGRPPVARTLSRSFGDAVEPALGEQDRLGADLRHAVGQAHEQVLVPERPQALERPEGIDPRLGQGGLRLVEQLCAAARRPPGPAARRSAGAPCRDTRRRDARARATSSAVVAWLKRGGGAWRKPGGAIR